MFRKKDRKNDHVVHSIRHQRAVTAVDRVLVRPAFAGVRGQLRTFADSDLLDARRLALAGGNVRPWIGAAALANALRAASALSSDDPAQLWLSEEPEARWIRAPLRDLARSLSADVRSLTGNVTLLTEDDRALVIDIEIDADDQRWYTSTLYGAWDPAFTEAMAP